MIIAMYRKTITKCRSSIYLLESREVQQDVLYRNSRTERSILALSLHVPQKWALQTKMRTWTTWTAAPLRSRCRRITISLSLVCLRSSPQAQHLELATLEQQQATNPYARGPEPARHRVSSEEKIAKKHKNRQQHCRRCLQSRPEQTRSWRVTTRIAWALPGRRSPQGNAKIKSLEAELWVTPHYQESTEHRTHYKKVYLFKNN